MQLERQFHFSRTWFALFGSICVGALPVQDCLFHVSSFCMIRTVKSSIASSFWVWASSIDGNIVASECNRAYWNLLLFDTCKEAWIENTILNITQFQSVLKIFDPANTFLTAMIIIPAIHSPVYENLLALRLLLRCFLLCISCNIYK